MTIPEPAGPLLTLADLRVWLTGRAELADDDQLGLLMVEAASERVRSAASQPAWTAATAPPRARQIAGHLAARSYLNPDSVSAEGALGPLGGDRTVEELAKALHLTAAETTELAAMSPAATGSGGAGGLWVQPLGDPNALESKDVYLPDDSLSDWQIPYYSAYDPLRPWER